jgi:hypothetical protein
MKNLLTMLTVLTLLALGAGCSLMEDYDGEDDDGGTTIQVENSENVEINQGNVTNPAPTPVPTLVPAAAPVAGANLGVLGLVGLLGLMLQGCAIGSHARVSLGASASVGYNAGSLSTPQESGVTNTVHRAGGGSVEAKASGLPGN